MLKVFLEKTVKMAKTELSVKTDRPDKTELGELLGKMVQLDLLVQLAHQGQAVQVDQV